MNWVGKCIGIENASGLFDLFGMLSLLKSWTSGKTFDGDKEKSGSVVKNGEKLRLKMSV